MDYKEIKRKEVLFEIIDDVTNGMDIYNHNGSLWIINTKELKWVVEFTNDKTLWYNYNLFKNLFKAISLDVSENQKYITEWFESKFLNVYTVKTTVDPFFDQDQYVEDTIQNGVKDTHQHANGSLFWVEDTIQNGVKDTRRTRLINLAAAQMVEDTIQNGVKDITYSIQKRKIRVENTIKNGVKHTDCYDGRRSTKVEDTIQNGVKETKRALIPRNIKAINVIKNGVKHTEDGDWLDGDERIGDIIQEGVKETIPTLRRTLLGVDDIVQNGVKETCEDVYHHRHRIFGVIKNGVKEVQPLPAQDGNMDWGNYYNGKEDRTKPFNAYLNDTITYGKKIIKNDK